MRDATGGPVPDLEALYQRARDLRTVNAGPNLSKNRRLKTEQVSAPSRRSAPPVACRGAGSSRP